MYSKHCPKCLVCLINLKTENLWNLNYYYSLFTHEEIETRSMSVLPKVPELISDGGGVVPRPPAWEPELLLQNSARSSCVFRPFSRCHVSSFCSGSCAAHSWDYLQGRIRGRTCPDFFLGVRFCPVLVCAALTVSPARLSGDEADSCLVSRGHGRGRLLFFLSFGNSRTLLQPCVSNTNLWGSCLCSFIRTFDVALTSSLFYIVC